MAELLPVATKGNKGLVSAHTYESQLDVRNIVGTQISDDWICICEIAQFDRIVLDIYWGDFTADLNMGSRVWLNNRTQTTLNIRRTDVFKFAERTLPLYAKLNTATKKVSIYIKRYNASYNQLIVVPKYMTNASTSSIIMEVDNSVSDSDLTAI